MTDAATPSRTPLQGDAALVRALGPFQLGASIVNIIVDITHALLDPRVAESL